MKPLASSSTISTSGGASSFDEARHLVSLRKKRWASTGGGTLALVDPDWIPGLFESFLIETSPGKFVEDKGGVYYG